jgi:hypothetical protein
MMPMRTIQDNSSPDDYSFWKRTRRNVSLLRRMVLMIYGYFTVGRRVRRIYREKEARGEIFYVDEDMPS